MSVTIDNIVHFQKKNEDNINILLNIIFVVYAFFLPISVDGYSRSFLFSIMLLLVAFRGNYFYYFKYSFSHPIVIAFLLYASMHYFWLIGTDNISWAERMLDQAKVAFYPILFFSFLDKRFTLTVITGFLVGMMVSELISYAIHFKLIPWQFILHDVVYPWKSHAIDITFYSAHSPIDPSPFLHHSFYSAAIALSTSILIYRLIQESLSRYVQLISILFIVTMTINMLIVGGRTGYILYGILLFSLIFMIYKRKSIKPFIISVTLLFSIFSIAYFNNGLFTQRIDQTITTLKALNANSMNFNSSFGYRLGIWYYGLDVIKDSPFLGTGTGDQIDTLHTKIKPEHNFLKTMPDMHNHYFSILLQFGLIGFLFLVNIYYQIFKFDTKNKELNVIKNLILITMLVTAVTATYWYFYLPTYVLLISTITSNRITISSQIPKLSAKLILLYAILILSSYIMEKLQ